MFRKYLIWEIWKQNDWSEPHAVDGQQDHKYESNDDRILWYRKYPFLINNLDVCTGWTDGYISRILFNGYGSTGWKKSCALAEASKKMVPE